jgi:hypothetical protein
MFEVTFLTAPAPPPHSPPSLLELLMHNRFLLVAAVAFLTTSLSAQQVQFSTALDEPNNVMQWTVNTSLGSVNLNPTTFRIGGSVELKLDSATAPFSTGSLNGALAFTNPATLNGTIPNPLPFLPPLATFKINDMQFHLAAPPFSIDPAGNFTAIVVLTSTAGSNTMGGLFGSGTEPIAGLESLPTAVAGHVTESGSVINFHLALNIIVSMIDPSTGISIDISLVGPLDSYTDVADANSLHLDMPMPALGGTQINLAYTNATPNSNLYLAGSLAGLGSFSVPQLGVTLDLAAPLQAGIDQADNSGGGTFQVSVPSRIAGRSIWAQALQSGRTSNVTGTWVQ